MEARLKSPGEKLREILQSKVEVDAHVALEDRQKNKETIIEAIIGAAQKLPVCYDQIIRVATHPQFHIFCTTIEHIREMTAQSVAAVCTLNDNCIHLSAGYLNPQIVNHEFRHADLFLRHKDFVPHLLVAPFPVLPTPDNIRNYVSALDKGDDRIRRFKRLWEKEKLKRGLSLQEKEELRLYEAAVQECQAPLIADRNKLENLAALEALELKPGSIVEKGLEKMRILAIRVEKQQIIIEMEPAEPALCVFAGLEVVHEKLANDHYRDKSFIEKLIERDAYTFQCLSEKAIKMFYPEASAMLREDIKLAERNYKRDQAEVLISKQNIFQKIDAAHEELISLSKAFADKDLESALVKKDFSLAVRRLSAHGGLALMKQAMAYVDADKKIVFDINSRSTNGNTALDWADKRIKDPVLKQSTMEFLASKGARRGCDLSATL